MMIAIPGLLRLRGLEYLWGSNFPLQRVLLRDFDKVGMTYAGIGRLDSGQSCAKWLGAPQLKQELGATGLDPCVILGSA